MRFFLRNRQKINGLDPQQILRQVPLHWSYSLSDNIISYIDMCRREGTSLQQGMNFGIGGNHSVILMSVRRNAPYKDRLEDEGTTLVYEGHDQPRGPNHPNPKTFDQPERFPSGRLAQNGKFHEAAQLYKAGNRPPERVRVYEKIQTGIWSYSGFMAGTRSISRSV